MLKAITLSTLFALTLTAVPNAAEARNPYSAPLPRTSLSMRNQANIQAREARQIRRIYQGIMNGKLTWSEANRLFAQQAKIERTLARYMRDGTLRGWEIRRLASMQHRASRHIARLSANRHVRLVHLRPGVTRRAVPPATPVRPVRGPRPVTSGLVL